MEQEDCGYVVYVDGKRFVTPKGKKVWQNIAGAKNAVRCHGYLKDIKRVDIAKLVPSTYQSFTIKVEKGGYLNNYYFVENKSEHE